ncbi:unnamed protein product, partial [Choristocarpus tenellus]
IQGFTVDGRLSAIRDTDSYANKCVYVRGEADPTRIEYNGHAFPSSINGLVLNGLKIQNCLGECVRLRYFVTHSDIQNNLIRDCGVADFVLGGNKKNGEGVYIGTSSTQWDDNPTDEADGSNYNRLRNNKIITNANECVDIKEGSQYNVVEGNSCSMQKDDKAGCFGVRSDYNTLRYNAGISCDGFGVRFGGHDDWGINNIV